MKRRLMALLLIAACGVPESVNPLVPAEKGVLDKALLGTWVGGEKDDEMVLNIAQKAGAVLLITSPRDEKTPIVFEAHASVLDGVKYLNARAFEDGKPASNWLIVKYELAKDGSLTLYTMTDAPVREAFEKKSLKGEAKGSPAQLTITDSVEKLTAFMRKSKGLYEKFGTFTRKP